MSAAYEPVRKLSAVDAVETFDCGHPALNQFIQCYALVNQKANSAQTYVCCLHNEVVGFYSLAVGSVDPEDAPARAVKGLARHPVPVMILARTSIRSVLERFKALMATPLSWNYPHHSVRMMSRQFKHAAMGRGRDSA